VTQQQRLGVCPSNVPPGPSSSTAGQPRPQKGGVGTRKTDGRRPADVFYGFDEPPFAVSADPRFFFHSAAHDRAAQQLLSAIRAHENIVAITGERGTGKTILCRTVIEELDRRTLTSFVPASAMSVEGLLAALLCDFGVMSRDVMASGITRARSRRELSSTLRDFLQLLASLQASAVAFIDDAHLLSTDVLQEIRIWADPESDLRLLQFVLIGQPMLPRRLRQRELRSLAARVATRISVGPIPSDEVGGYIAHRLATAGAAGRVEFDEGAVEAIAAATRGVPLAINLLCERALEKGCAASMGVIVRGTVAEAASEVEGVQLQVPWRVWTRRTLVAAALVLLMIAGVAGAAWVFRAPLDRLVEHWTQPATPPFER
jgi:type II secretory pathway predicted ATPase ExeA